jgi:hypothetical protein
MSQESSLSWYFVVRMEVKESPLLEAETGAGVTNLEDYA